MMLNKKVSIKQGQSKRKSKKISIQKLGDILIEIYCILFITAIIAAAVLSVYLIATFIREYSNDEPDITVITDEDTSVVDDIETEEYEVFMYAPSMRIMEPEVVGLSCVSEREELYHSTIPTMSWFDVEYNDYYWTTIDPYMKTYPIKIQNDNFTIWSDVRTRSGLTESDLTALFDRYYPYLQGYESTIINAEELYGINSIFIIAVCCSESGGFEKNRTNGFGIKSVSFDSGDESIYKFAELMHSGYISRNLTTPITISERYCPDSNKTDLKNEWADLVVNVENLIHRRLESVNI